MLRQYVSVHTDLALEAHDAAIRAGWDKQGVSVSVSLSMGAMFPAYM